MLVSSDDNTPIGTRHIEYCDLTRGDCVAELIAADDGQKLWLHLHEDTPTEEQAAVEEFRLTHETSNPQPNS